MTVRNWKINSEVTFSFLLGFVVFFYGEWEHSAATDLWDHKVWHNRFIWGGKNFQNNKSLLEMFLSSTVFLFYH